MKKIILFSFVFIFLVNCSDDDGILSPGEQNAYREVAYNSLSEQDKESITVNWKEAKINEGTLLIEESSTYIKLSSGSKLRFILNVTDYPIWEGRKLVAVAFNTMDDALLGPIIVIVDTDKEIVIGFVGRL